MLTVLIIVALATGVAVASMVTLRKTAAPKAQLRHARPSKIFRRNGFRPIHRSKARRVCGPQKPKIDWVTGRRVVD